MNQNRSFCQIISGFHLCRGIPEIAEHNQLFLSQISQDYVNNRLTGFLICVQPIYSAPLTYVALLLHGGVESYPNAVAEYKPYEN